MFDIFDRLFPCVKKVKIARCGKFQCVKSRALKTSIDLKRASFAIDSLPKHIQFFQQTIACAYAYNWASKS